MSPAIIYVANNPILLLAMNVWSIQKQLAMSSNVFTVAIGVEKF